MAITPLYVHHVQGRPLLYPLLYMYNVSLTAKVEIYPGHGGHVVRKRHTKADLSESNIQRLPWTLPWTTWTHYKTMKAFISEKETNAEYGQKNSSNQ